MDNHGNVSRTVIIGLALFASFFGAGNLIFPPAIGIAAGSGWHLALTGFVISGVILPVLSFVAVARANGTEEGVTAEMGKTFSYIFISIIMLCISLVVAVPRTAATTHELGIVPLFGPLPRLLTAFIYFAIVLYFSINQTTAIEKIGKYLTPILVVILAVIVVDSFRAPIGVPGDTGLVNPFRNGFLNGYQTLDVFGGLVFSGAIFAAIKSYVPDDRKTQIKMALGCTLIAGLGLFFVYGGLLHLGATGTGQFAPDMDRPALLVGLINRLLGHIGPQSLACATIFACLTTAIGLTTGASYFFSRVTKGRLPYKFNAIFISVASLFLSLGGVDAIINYTVPILTFIYPATIVLVLLTVFRCRCVNRGTYRGAVYITLLIGLLQVLPTLGVHIPATTAFLNNLPLAADGFAWVTPAVLFGIIGTLACHLIGHRTSPAKTDA